MAFLFKKAACFTDLHFGLKNNQRMHNDDCERFIIWFCEEAKKANADTCIFLGDWHDSRRVINVSTLNYSVSALKILSKSFKQVFLLSGNHDLYYREKREINSIVFGNIIKNITIVDKPLEIDDVYFFPWLVENEWKQISKIKTKYIFGHFELPDFLMNASIKMPNIGKLKTEDFKTSLAFSGHFHKRQRKNNVMYIGNAFPHNYSDAWDDNRGMMLLEWGSSPIFKSWPDAPKYRTMLLSEVINKPEYYIGPNTYARVSIDIDISYEEALLIKDTFTKKYKAREINLLPMSTTGDAGSIEGEIEFQSVDKVVISGLKSVESNTIDNNLLIKLYRSL